MKLKLVVLCPHFDPDTAPTGHVMTRIVHELAVRGHELHVVTSLPWYRDHEIAPGWDGRVARTERTPWGSITRVHPFPGDDKRNLVRRAAGFFGFSLLAGVMGLRVGGWFRRADAVIAMSPPLTLGLTGWVVARLRRAPLVFNIQDVFPDAAVRTGAITNSKLIAVAEWLERFSYHRSDAVTVLSSDLRDNVVAKIGPRRAATVHIIPNFVDTEQIVPGDRMTAYRRELDIGDEPVVLYAGNVGFSQSLDLVLAAAETMSRHHVRHQRRGSGSVRTWNAVPRVWRTCASATSNRSNGCRRCWRPVMSTSCPCGRGSATSACRRRPIRFSRLGGRCSLRSTAIPRYLASSRRHTPV